MSGQRCYLEIGGGCQQLGERREREVRECRSLGSTQLLHSQLFSLFPPDSSRSGGLEGCSGRGAATASCSLNQEPPPACLLQPPCLSCTFYSAVEQNTTTCSASLIILQKEAKVSLNQYYSPSAGQQPLSCKCNLSSLLLLLTLTNSLDANVSLNQHQ